ncbi:unnamed protein product, partial [Nesidiocoris tenuis]
MFGHVVLELMGYRSDVGRLPTPIANLPSAEDVRLFDVVVVEFVGSRPVVVGFSAEDAATEDVRLLDVFDAERRRRGRQSCDSSGGRQTK